MHEALDLNQQIQAAQRRLQQIEQQASRAEPASLTAKAIAELATALDELQATATELHEQNQALFTSQQALVAEHQRYQNLFDFAPDAYLITDGQGTLLAINSAAKRLLNLHHNWAVGKPLTVFIAEADHAFFFAQLERINATPPPQASEPTSPFTLFLQGQEVWLTPRQQPVLPTSLSLSGEWNQQGKITQLYWIFHDLRARKQSEAALRESEAKYRSLFNEMTEAYGVAQIILNDDGEPVDYRMLEVNPQFERLTGLARDLVLGGRTMRDIVPDLEADWHQLYGRVALTGESIRFEKPVARRGHWHDVHAFRIGDPEDRHVAILFDDVSDRKRLALALQASQAQLGQILDSAIAIIISFRVFENGDWEYDYFSSGCESILGYPAEAFMADKLLWRSRLHPDDLSTVEGLFADLFAERLAVWEYRFYHRDGALRWLSNTYASQKIADGCWQITVVGQDVSDRKQAELTLRRQIQQEYLLNDITEDIRQSLDLEAVLARAVERSRAVLESDRVIVFRFGGSGEGTVIAESVGNGFRPILATAIYDPCFSDRCAEAYCQGRVGAIDDIEQADLEPCHGELLLRFQVKASLVVPILQGDGLWGLLIAHQCAAPRQWQPAEIALLKRIASKTSVAVQQSELYGQVLHELHERERIQQVLQQSEARFRTLSATAPIGIGQIDANGQCVYANDRWQEIAGLSVAASLGDGWMQVVHPDDRAPLFNAWREYRAGHRRRMPEFRLLTPTGDLRWVAVAIAPLPNATGDIQGYVTAIEDITQRKEADRKIREQAALLDIASDAIFVRALDHRLLYWNQGAERLYGWSAAEVLNRPVHEVLRGDLPQLSSIMQTLYTEGEWRGELHEITKAGQAVTVAARWTLVLDEAGQPRFILSVETDITEKKALEAQFYQAQRLESLGRLSSGIAHDLNNVFTPILTMAQLLRFTQRSLSTSAQEQLRLLEDSARRGISMVQQILSITRSSSGVRTEIDLPPLLQDLARMLEQSLPKSIALRQTGFGPGAKLPWVSADPTHLHQVLMNLCVNARDAMPKGGTLTLSAQAIAVDAAAVATNLDAQVGQYVRLTVADTGTGIDPSLRDRIFDPFFTTKGQGTGLGLATVLGIVKASDGFVQVESGVGQGTQMHIYLPALEVPSESDAPQAAWPDEPESGRGELILVVDDDAAVQHTLRSLLANYNYTPLVASSGPAALDLYAQHQPALVVLDMMMPGMDGLTLIQHLRATQPDLTIVATSGLATYQAAALAAGAQVFLPKPYDLRDLLKTIAALLG